MRLYPRLLELVLLILALSPVLVSIFAVHQACYPDHALLGDLLPFAVPLGSFVLAHWALSFLQPRANQVLLPIVTAITGIGLVFLYRLRADFTGANPPHPFHNQANVVVLGVLSLIVLAAVRDVRIWGRFKYLCMLAGFSLLMITARWGDVVHGKALKISVGSFEFQPTELVKLLLVIFMAGYLADRTRLISQRWGRWVLSAEDFRYLGPLFIVWIASQMLLFYQKDLGAALLFFGIFLAMIYVANARAVYVLIGVLMFCAGAAYAYFFSHRTQQRIRIWLDPWSTAAGDSYQLLRGLYALGFGGLLGAGWGHGAPHLIPAVQTDFIFVGLAEEIGLVGALGILVLYLALIWQGFKISLDAQSNFAALLAAGLTMVLGIQVLVILGGCLRAIPLTGVPVPFLSRGGTNMVCNLALVGMLLAISAAPRETAPAGSAQRVRPVTDS